MEAVTEAVPTESERWMKAGDVAEMLDVTEAHIHNLCKAGRLRSYRIGLNADDERGPRRIRIEDVREFLAGAVECPPAEVSP